MAHEHSSAQVRRSLKFVYFDTAIASHRTGEAVVVARKRHQGRSPCSQSSSDFTNTERISCGKVILFLAHTMA